MCVRKCLGECISLQYAKCVRVNCGLTGCATMHLFLFERASVNSDGTRQDVELARIMSWLPTCLSKSAKTCFFNSNFSGVHSW